MAKLLSGFPIFRLLKPKLLYDLSDQAAICAFKKGDILIDEDWKQSPGLYLLIKGEVEVVSLSGESPVFLAQRYAGDILGELSIMDNKRPSATVRATKAVEAVLLERKHVLQTARKSFPFCAELFQTVSTRLREADHSRILSRTSKTTAMVCQRIIEQIQIAAYKGQYPRTILLSQSGIAEELGLTRETVNKVFAKLMKLEPPPIQNTKSRSRHYRYQLELLKEVARERGNCVKDEAQDCQQ